MKYSKYNLLRIINGNYYIVNILTSKYLKITKSQYEKILNNESTDEDLLNLLFENGMLVNKDVDELDYLKKRYDEEQQRHDLLTITIAPTLRCNFNCTYCYENKNGKIIDEASQLKIINFIEKQLLSGYKKLNLIWFGGEPLMAFSIIKNMSKKIIEICDKYNVDYNAFMTTNGYLLSDDIISDLKKLKINQLYITLDGDSITHNRRRCLLNGEPTFDTIVENLYKLKKSKINTVIRMNIDKTNEIAIEKLRDIVTNQLSLPMYLGLVRKYTDSCQDDGIYFDKKRYSEIQDEFENRQALDKPTNNKLPRQLPIYCRACKVGTFVIDPDLNIFKCENDIGRYDKRISTIDDYQYENEIGSAHNHSYYDWNPFEFDKCVKCDLLPICTGGCPYIGIKNNEPECEIYKYNIDNYIKKYILQVESNLQK